MRRWRRGEGGVSYFTAKRYYLVFDSTDAIVASRRLKRVDATIGQPPFPALRIALAVTSYIVLTFDGYTAIAGVACTIRNKQQLNAVQK